MGDTRTEEQPALSVEPVEETYTERDSDREMPCPMCGASMPDLKGGKASICPNCGFKDSCCF